MFCPNCGKQNTDHAIACAFCEHPLERPKPRFKGTMMMNAPPAGAAEPGAGSIGKPSDPPPARSPKKTMVGGFAIPPGGLKPPGAEGTAPAPAQQGQQNEPAEPLPTEPLSTQPAAGRSPKKTMIGGIAVPPGGLKPPSAGDSTRATSSSEPASPKSTPKKTMIGGFAIPPGGLQPPAASASPEAAPEASPEESSGAEKRTPKKTMIGGFAVQPEQLKPAGAPEATKPAEGASQEPAEPVPSGQWDYGDEDTPASGLSLPSEEETKRPSAEFDRTLVAGMISAADLPPPPESASAPDSGGSESGASDKLETARKRSPMLLLLSATLIGVFALFIGYKTLVSGGEGALEIEQHRFALEGVVSAILLTCEADPSGSAAIETIRLPADSPLKSKICDFKPSALEAIGDSSRVQGKRLSESSVTGFPGSEGLDRERCVLFRSGSALIVTCDNEEIGITPVFFQNIGEL